MGGIMSVRWDPLKDILSMHDRINRVFNDSFQKNDLSGAGEWLPPVDIYETETEIVILAELPGIPEDAIDIQLNEGVLILRGEKSSPHDNETDSYYRLERPFGKFSRSFTLPNGLELSDIKASIRDGVLKITIVKARNRLKNIKVTKD